MIGRVGDGVREIGKGGERKRGIRVRKRQRIEVQELKLVQTMRMHLANWYKRMTASE